MIHSSKRFQVGFTLVEIAIVLMIVAILLGYTVAMFPVQQDLKKYRQVDREMDEIIEHLIAYAQVNGRLPCPDSVTGGANPDGLEDPNGINDCDVFFAFVPGRTLGINGKYDANGVLLDPWGVGYGYAISEVDAGDGNVDLVTANGIRAEGMINVLPDLFICDDSPATGDDDNCTDAASNDVLGLNNEVAAVVISLGKENTLPATSNIQDENADDFDDGTNDKVYIFAPRRDDYDDVVKWVPTNKLFSRMIEAEQLP